MILFISISKLNSKIVTRRNFTGSLFTRCKVLSIQHAAEMLESQEDHTQKLGKEILLKRLTILRYISKTSDKKVILTVKILFPLLIFNLNHTKPLRNSNMFTETTASCFYLFYVKCVFHSSVECVLIYGNGRYPHWAVLPWLSYEIHKICGHTVYQSTRHMALRLN